MKKKAIVSLCLAFGLLLAGCGSKTEAQPAAPASTTQTSTAKPTPAPAPAPAQSSADGFVGLWQHNEHNLWVQLWDDGTWAIFNELGGRVSEGTWTASGDTAALFDETGAACETLTISGSELLDSEGSALVAVEGIAAQETPAADKETFVGLWQFMDQDVWLQLWDDDTWALFNELGGRVGEGSWRVDLGSADLYNDDGSYYTSLLPDVGGLTDSNGNSLIHSDGPSAGAPADADDIDWDEVAALEGWWYPDGQLDAEQYLNFDAAGNWNYFVRSAGMEPTIVAEGTIVSSQGERHAYYATGSDGQSAYYFRFVPANESGSGHAEIFWNNDEVHFIWME